MTFLILLLLLLTQLDLRAAFDTIHHDILLHWLKHVFSIIRNFALSFFQSYLTERKQMVSISGYGSNPSTLLHCIPQGSVLGRILFLLYTEPHSLIIDRHSVSHCEFVDDRQLYQYMIQFHVNIFTLFLITCSQGR